MGTLRLLLALMVALGHYSFYANSLPYFIPGDVAVEAFYIVSGFLITLVLSEKYKHSLFLFYSNRFLRIFPIYWVCLGLYIIVNVLVVKGIVPSWQQGGQDFRSSSALWWADQNGQRLNFTETIALVFVNLSVFGQDIVRGFGKATPDLFYHQFVYIRVAWTIGVELTFYIIAPFVVRRIWLTVLLMCVSFIMQIWVLNDPNRNPLDYQLFPFELCYFLAGSLAYRAYVLLRSRRGPWVNRYAISSCAALLVLIVVYKYIPGARFVYLATVITALPGIVQIGRKNRFDGNLGDLSYPLYLVHPLFVIFFLPGNTVFSEFVALGLALALCFVLVYLVEKPIDRIRQARVGAGATA